MAARGASGLVAASAPTLSVRNLSIEFQTPRGWLSVVDGVDLTVERGQTVGIVGESGSGKTVTSLAVMGLHNPRQTRVSGSIQLEGRELVGLSERQLADVRGRDMGMIFQEPRRSLNPGLTIGNQISEVVVRHEGVSQKAASKRAREMLDLVGIADAGRRMNDYAHQFSGGMCQRVMLALALVCRPKLLIADEPTTALDVTVQAQVMQLMNELQAEFGLSILFITHDLGVVAEMCDEVAVMYSGQLAEISPLYPLFEKPKHPYTAGLLASVPEQAIRGERLPSIPGTVPPPWERPTGCRFRTRCPFAQEGRCDVGEIPLISPSEGRAARCVRVHELDLEGVRA